MAKFQAKMSTELIKEISKLEKDTEKICGEMVKAGAQVALCSTTEEGALKAKENLLKEFPSSKVYAQKTDVSKELELKNKYY